MHPVVEPASKLKRASYFSKICGLYIVTLLLAVAVLRPTSLLGQPTIADSLPATVSQPQTDMPVVFGRPTRIVIPSLGVDLPVDKGFYDAASGDWTLSGYHAQFAMLSNLANNTSGNTFIYGHDNPYVFEHLNRLSTGAQALVYTDNNRVFSYIYQNTHATTPSDTSVLNYQGPPIMTVQTCSGAWFEQRQMYLFKFDRVV